jgi:hypothetical protein
MTTEPETVDIDYKGTTYTLPASMDDCDVAVLEAFEGGKLTAALSGILGERQYTALKAKGLKVRDLNELTDLIVAAMGFGDRGE